MLQALADESTESFYKDEASLLAVAPDLVDDIWSICRAQLALAASWTRKVSLDVLHDELIKGLAQLWIVWAPKQEVVLCSFVTDIQQYGSGWKEARVLLLGGGRLEVWRHLLKEIEDWAVAEGCDGIAIIGRKGWQRVFPEYAHSETVIVKEF